MTLALMKKQERKEDALHTLEVQLDLNKREVIRSGISFQKKLDIYKQWLKENNMEGIRYK